MTQEQYNIFIQDLLDEVGRNNEEIQNATKLLHEYSEEQLTKDFTFHIHTLATRNSILEQKLKDSRWN